MSVVETSPEDPEEEEYDPEALEPFEAWWRDLQPWLKDCGYMLRPRYRVDWIPSWRGTNKFWAQCEDGRAYTDGSVLDAVRISDGKLVGLKQVDTVLHPFEVGIHKFLTSEALASDLDNHCVPLYEVLQVPSEPNTVILVMPYLRRFGSPRIETFGEAVDFFRQAFKGMQFIHQHGVAHRDGHGGNLMYDGAAMFPEGYHPHPLYNNRKSNFKGRAKRYTRTQVPPRYYWIDFGISNQYDPSSMVNPTEERIWGGDRSVPEYVDYKGPCNPFPIDVYYVGNLIKTNFIDVKFGFSFMTPLISDMVHEDPAKRPTMAQVVIRFDEIQRSLSQWKLWSRIVDREESRILGIYRTALHAVQAAQYLLTRKPAVPAPVSPRTL